jgi:creatinine amidohydrolase
MIKNWETLYEVKGPKSIMEMTAAELEEVLKETDTVILSFGAVENHSVHLPLGADYFQANVLMRRVAECLEEMGHKAVPGLAVPFGTQTNKFERDKLKGNCFLNEKTFIDMVEDLILALHETGFNRFLLVMNHSENHAALNVAAKDLANRFGIKSIVTDWVPPHNDFWPTVLKNPEHQGHAGEDETACCMVAVPGLVHKEGVPSWYPPEDKKPLKFSGLYYYGGSVGVYMPTGADTSPGYVGDPADADAEEGILCYDAYASWVAGCADKYLFDM